MFGFILNNEPKSRLLRLKTKKTYLQLTKKYKNIALLKKTTAMIAFADMPLAAKSVTQISNNPILANLNKYQHKKHAFSTLKFAVGIATSTTGVNQSEKVLQGVKKLKSILPQNSEQLGPIPANIQFKDNFIKNYQLIKEFIGWLSKFELDDKNTKQLLDNLKQSVELMEYVIDYITVAITSQEAIEELKGQKNLYTSMQLKEKFLPAA